jgi:hypothetical protein
MSLKMKMNFQHCVCVFVCVQGKPLIAEFVTEEEADVATGSTFRAQTPITSIPTTTASEVHSMSTTSQKQETQATDSSSTSSQRMCLLFLITQTSILFFNIYAL